MIHCQYIHTINRTFISPFLNIRIQSIEDHFLRIEQVKRSWNFGRRLRWDWAVVIDSSGFVDGLGLAMSTGGGARVLEMDKEPFLNELG